MKTIKQLLRQPVRSTAGMMVVAMAVAVLVASVGQYAATNLTRAELDDMYDTVAVLSDEYFWSDKPGGGRFYASKLPEEIQQWVAETLAERTDLVKIETYPQLYSAYVPGMWHDNFSQHGVKIDDSYFRTAGGDPYRCAMLEVTITHINPTIEEDTIVVRGGVGEQTESEWQILTKSVTLHCMGRVEKVIGLERGFTDPVGQTIDLIISAASREALAEMALVENGRYMVYGLDYKSDAEAKNVSLTVCNYASLPAEMIGENGIELRTDLRCYNYREEGQWKFRYVLAEEFEEKYSLPTVAALEGTAEDFLKSEEATLWRQTLEEMEYSLHGFPVLAVDKLGYQLAFARGEARIVEGRDFTEAERTDASRVCIISEAVARASGLAVGDVISLRTYALDPSVGSSQDNKYSPTTFPTAAIYSGQLGFTSETENYTIVGLYRQNNAWQDAGYSNPYGLSPDTIFVPMGSISGDTLTGTRGIFYTLVLQNGKMAEFRALQENAGYPDLYICMDGGYTEILAGLDAYKGVSTNALKIGILGCAVIMLLFVVFFPLQQGKTLAIMSSLGASRGKRIQHVVVSSLCLLIPGAILGCAAGLLIWEPMAAELMESVNVQIPLAANMTTLAPTLTAEVCAVMAAVIFLVAVLASGSKGLMRKK